MRIAELTTFSAGICGVWTRVKEEAVRLAEKGHEVKIFSTNFVKGSELVAPRRDKIGKVEIVRFKAKRMGGESFAYWNFKKEVSEFKPDVIIVHAYRHSHTTSALELKKELKCKVFLVTHAPFVEEDKTRSFLAKQVVRFYDRFVGPKTVNKFDKIVTITKWERPYLNALGAREDKIEYIPNGIPEEFFKMKTGVKENNKILFLGRISPIKDLETLIRAFKLVKNKKTVLEIVGPAEESYLRVLMKVRETLGLKTRVIFSGAVHNLREKIEKIDSAKVFVLPSKREAMPQALIEAMARKKIVIASSNPGSREIVQNTKNGFLFNCGDEKELAELIDKALEKRNEPLRKEARKSVEQFVWNKVIEKLTKILNK